MFRFAGSLLCDEHISMRTPRTVDGRFDNMERDGTNWTNTNDKLLIIHLKYLNFYNIMEHFLPASERLNAFDESEKNVFSTEI